MKRFSKLISFIVVFVAVMAAFCTVSFAATVGQPLKSPETGWQRIDDTDKRIITNSHSYPDPNVYNGSYTLMDKKDDYFKFRFYGSKLRIITTTNEGTYHGGDFKIKIDDNEYILNTAGKLNYQILKFENTELELGTHNVTIYNPTGGYFAWIDAIDVDSIGYLIDYNAPSSLITISGNASVDLSWDIVEGAANYIVKRSFAPGGPYTTIATTSAITYTDISVTNGTTYYYVVSAVVNEKESDNSNEASATPTAPPVLGNPAILEITMINGQIKEYDLTAAELQSFLTWYDNRTEGIGKASYIFTKKSNITPFLSRKEYISFDKISSFEVKEYTE